MVPTAPQGSNVIVIDESESEGNASNSMAIQSEISVPLRHATLACAKKLGVHSDICFGMFPFKDLL